MTFEKGNKYGFKKGHKGYWKGKIFSKAHRKSMSLAFTPARKKQTSIRCSKTMIGNTHRKDFTKTLIPEERALWEKENGRKISNSLKSNTEYMKILKDRMMGNTFGFKKGYTPFMKGKKLSEETKELMRLSFTPERRENIRIRMSGNSLVLDYRKRMYPEKYKVYEIFKSYNSSFVKFSGELKFNPLVNGRAWFLKYGLSTPNAPHSPPTNTF